MPEGDNVHRSAVALAERLVGKPLAALHVRGRSAADVQGQVIKSIEPRGKHLLIGVGDQLTIHVHLGIHGRIRLVPARALPAWAAQRASLVLIAGAAAAVFTRAAVVELLRSAFVHAHPTLHALGPDLLARDVSIDAIVARARKQTSAASTAADLLLDQRIACGVGNVYKSEVLFLERVDPWTPVSELSDTALAGLYERACQLLRGNLGPWPRTTTADRSRGEWIPRGRGRTHVYGRRGRPCFVCGTPIQSKRQGTQLRTTYFCPSCQRQASGNHDPA
jgi:endonuclease-8